MDEANNLPIMDKISKNLLSRQFRQKIVPYALLMPALLIILGLIIYPLINSLQMSFTNFNFAFPETRFVGFRNYIDALLDKEFWYSLRLSVIYTSSSTTVAFLLGLGTALLLNREFRGKRFFTTLFILPMMVTPVIAALLWLLLYLPDFSVLNYFLTQIGFNEVPWLVNPNAAMAAIIIADVWQWTPFFTLALLSGLTGLQEELFEAAKVDGASSRQEFFFITLPLLKPVILVAILLRVLDSFRTFDVPYVMLDGGPGRATELLSLHIFRKGFYSKFMGAAAARSFLFVIILTVIVTILIRIMRTPEES